MKKLCLLVLVLWIGPTHADSWTAFQLRLIDRLKSDCKVTFNVHKCNGFRTYAQNLVPFGTKEKFIDSLIYSGELTAENKEAIIETVEEIEIWQRRTAPVLVEPKSLKVDQAPMY